MVDNRPALGSGDDSSKTLTKVSAVTNVEFADLETDNRHVRLLTIQPGSFNDNIECRLNSISLETHPVYTALSYSWADQTEDAKITVDDREIIVTKGLEIALRYWRDTEEDLIIWVDAICINQENLAEKSAQVGMMGSIYANASQVRIWLGESANDSDAAMDFVNQFDPLDFQDPTFHLDPQIWVAVLSLWRRKWWTRLWVVQEIMLARNPKFYCGCKTASVERFQLVAQMEKQYKWTTLPGLRPLLAASAMGVHTFLDDWDFHRTELAKGGLPINRVITMTHGLEYSNPLDRIFAILSLCIEVDRQSIPVDYSISVRRLMVEVYQSTKDPTLPSWTPDYTHYDAMSYLIFNGFGGRIPYRAAADNATWTALGFARPSLEIFDWFSPTIIDGLNSAEVVFEDESSDETLVLIGLILDVVSTANPAPWVDIYSGLDPEEDFRVKQTRRQGIIRACHEWETLVCCMPAEKNPYEKTCGRYDAFWRTLMADRDLQWYGPPSPDWDFAGRFEAWMGRRADVVDDDDEYIRPFHLAAMGKLWHRSFLTTEQGYLGLGSCRPQSRDLVCIFRGGNVPFVVRPRADGYFQFVGEAYIHGIMDGSFVQRAKKQDVRTFRIR